MVFIEVFVVLIFLLFVGIPLRHAYYVHFLSKYLQNIPGPTANPYFGNILKFVGKTDQSLQIICDLFNEYGNIIKIFSGPFKTSILIADEKLLEAILSSNKVLDKSVEYTYLESWLGTGLLTSTGLKWKKHRRLITPAFHFSILENFVEVFEKCSDIFIKKLEIHGKDDGFNIYPMVSLLTLDIICETAMGILLNAQTSQDSSYPNTVKKICEIMNSKNFSPIIAIDQRLYPLTLNYYKEKNAIKILHSLTNAVINKKINNADVKVKEKENHEIGTKKILAFLDLLLLSTINGEYLPIKDIREEVDTFMFEGHDTTTSAISFALYALANHPKVQEKALHEQKLIFGDIKAAKPTMVKLKEMKYLELIIKETLRLYPPVPFYGRTISEEFKFETTIFPRGQQITIFPYISHRNPKYFPEPLKFMPERFNNMKGTSPYIYIPFSAGPRNCIGQKFAMLELKSTISKVLRNYELFPAKNYKMELAAELILISKSGICLSIKKRK